MSEKYGLMEKGCGNLCESECKAAEVQEKTQNQGREKLQDIPGGGRAGRAYWRGGGIFMDSKGNTGDFCLPTSENLWKISKLARIKGNLLRHSGDFRPISDGRGASFVKPAGIMREVG